MQDLIHSTYLCRDGGQYTMLMGIDSMIDSLEFDTDTIILGTDEEVNFMKGYLLIAGKKAVVILSKAVCDPYYKRRRQFWPSPVADTKPRSSMAYRW